jgi:Zn-dependent protease
MLRWSLNLFRVRGIQLSVHFSFFLLLAYVAYEGFKMDHWLGMAWSVGTLLAFFCCVIAHELGHSFTALHYGIGVRRILLLPIGGMAEFASIPREPARELLITAAGPAVNFVIAGVLALFVDLSIAEEYPATATGFAQLLLFANLLMGCFNLLPVFPMDGGRILRALLAWRMPYVRATFVAASIGKVLAVAGVLIALFIGESILTALLFTFIFLAGEAEYRAVRMREWEDSHWREMLARYYAPQPPNEPPILSR